MENPFDRSSVVPPTILIVSGGVGASAEQLVYTVLAQFPDQQVNVYTTGNVRQVEQIDQLLLQAQEMKAIIVHTLVDAALRDHLIAEAARKKIVAADLVGPVIGWLGQQLGQPALQQPGRYRRLHRDYFDRVAAIDFTLTHDDGKNPDGWQNAEIVLAGVSRAGKTPLSLYLAVLGWRVANIPLVPQVEVPGHVYTLDAARCIGLTIDAEQLLSYRRLRQSRLGVDVISEYTDLDAIEEELRHANKLFSSLGWSVINMTDRTIEMAADEVLRRVESRPPRALPL